MNGTYDLPYLTSSLPGTGGAIRVEMGDFAVEELPAYQPAGEGDHVFAWIEKSGVTTVAAAQALARAVGVSDRDVGSAGLKDRKAVARQFLSFPPPLAPEAILAAQVPGVRVLSATRHPHKLRTGHLRGNRFALIIRGIALPADEAAARAGAVLARLAEPPGSPNWYGEQRFGAAGDNASAGRALLRRDRRLAATGRRERRLLVSAYQSELFNRYLRRRLEDGFYATVMSGDLLSLRRGGLFATTDPATDQVRLDAGELAVTGPIYGHRMRAPAAGSDAAAREDAILAEEEVTPADFRHLGKLAPGTRRPLSIALEEIAVEPIGRQAIRVQFALPSGAYATAVLREIMKPDAAESGSVSNR